MNTKDVEARFKDTIRRAEVALASTKEGEVINFEKMLLSSSYGELSQNQIKLVMECVKGKTVFDLGAGDMTMSLALVAMGASHVVAIDKELYGRGMKITKYKESFEEFLKGQRGHLKHVDFPRATNVGFLSWPNNDSSMEGLMELLKPMKRIIYLGKNTDGSSCAWPGFFQTMHHRSVDFYMPEERNSLIIYGPHKDPLQCRDLVGEELAGMDQSKMFTFAEAEHEAKSRHIDWQREKVAKTKTSKR